MNLASDPETWVDRYGDYLYSYALARMRDPVTAEDLAAASLPLEARDRIQRALAGAGIPNG